MSLLHTGERRERREGEKRVREREEEGRQLREYNCQAYLLWSFLFLWGENAAAYWKVSVLCGWSQIKTIKFTN